MEFTYDPDCSSCWVNRHHSAAEHEQNRMTCSAWTCGRQHPITDHMSLTDSINWKNAEMLKRICGPSVHWGYVSGEHGAFENSDRRVFAINV